MESVSEKHDLFSEWLVLPSANSPTQFGKSESLEDVIFSSISFLSCFILLDHSGGLQAKQHVVLSFMTVGVKTLARKKRLKLNHAVCLNLPPNLVMAVSQNKGTPLWTPKLYNPSYGDP